MKNSGARLGLRPPRLRRHVGDSRPHRGTDDVAFGVDADDVDEEGKTCSASPSAAVAFGAAVAHFGLADERAQNLFRRGKYVLFVARRRTGGLHQPAVHVVDVAMDAVDALQHADEGDRRQGDNNGQRQAEAQRPARRSGTGSFASASTGCPSAAASRSSSAIISSPASPFRRTRLRWPGGRHRRATPSAPCGPAPRGSSRCRPHNCRLKPHLRKKIRRHRRGSAPRAARWEDDARPAPYPIAAPPTSALLSVRARAPLPLRPMAPAARPGGDRNKTGCAGS